MSLDKFDDAKAGEKTLLRALARLTTAEKERDLYRQGLVEAAKETQAMTARVALLERLDSLTVTPPKWVRDSPGKGKIHRALPCLLLSDMHFDEVVRPEEVEGTNCYNREIAVLRLRRTLENTVMVARKFFSGLTYEGFVLLLGGDCLSGDIHEELQQTNEDTVFGSLDFWSDQLAAFIGGLVDEFGKVHITGVVGNHGRLTRKPRAKLRVKDNLDWLLYRMVAKATGPQVTWTIPESADVDIPIYDKIYRLTHGDQFRGGSGAAGILSPLMLGRFKKVRRQMAIGKPFDYMVLGHFHEYIHGLGIIVNGALKGFDEYAYLNNMGVEQPTQAFWITTAKHGTTFSAPIYPMDRKAEKW